MSGNRRILSVVVLLLGISLALSPSAGADSTSPPLTSVGASTPTPNEYAIVQAMNAARAANGVRPLRVGRALTRAARAHSADMARNGYFDHGAFVRRLHRFGVRLPYVGENLATGTGLSASGIVQMWIASPPHRRNLLDGGFQRVGVGIAGNGGRLVTADFAGR
jgi:uncharacterized protein YkwD